MFFSQDRNQLRQVFFNAWKKNTTGEMLDPMENMIVNALKLHPEYHRFFSQAESNADKDFSPELGETNPFLHLGMHISIHEQLSINQPTGITEYYKKILQQTNDPHETEHQIMDCLGEMIWKAQREQQPPSEKVYFDCLAQKIKNK